ncbi:MAG TPA: endolytic transglycosylase MltG [Streptosporangiaceae bacterium]|nr:endolytic transglycosylase MltG [Streptosporangiaceae bacterium]
MSSGGAGWPPADHGGFGQGGRYGDEFGADHEQGSGGPGFFDDSGYEWSEPSGRSPSQGDPPARGRIDQYGQPAGRHSGGHPAAPSYGDAYGQDQYGQDSYGRGRQSGGRYAADEYGRDGYDQGGYGQDGYGQAGFGPYGEPGYGRDGYGRDLGPDRYAGGSYGHDGYGQEGYGQTAYYGQPARRSLPAPDGFGDEGYRPDGLSTDSYGRDLYTQEGYGPAGTAGPHRSYGGYQPPDGHGSDNGYSPGGSYGRQDTGPFGRHDTGSFAPPDRYLSDGRPDPFGQPDPFAQPAAGPRRPDPGGSAASSQDPGPAGGYDQWHEAADDDEGWSGDEPAEQDADWSDDADSGLLSRRFGSGSDGTGGRLSARRVARARRPKRLRGKFAVTAAILAGALVLGAVANFGYERFAAWRTARYGDYQGAGTGQVRFLVPEGAVLSSLGPALVKAGVIEEARPFGSAAAAAANASHLQPGVYLLHHHMSSALAVQYLLSSGHRLKDQVTIIEGTRASAIAQALAKQTGIPVAQFNQIIDHPPASLGLPSWARGSSAEGFLFPDTYTLLPKMTALQILQMMVTEFKQKVAAINLVGASKKVFTTPWHALIVASLIQAEAGSVNDFGRISRVVWNRLIAKMPLEFDSTVFYAMHTYGTYLKTPAQHNFKSPYNTYLHTGLPPGPIGNPGIAAMEAAVHAAHGNWLYFITDLRHKPYITHFTASHAQFQQWQQEFQG